MLILSTSIDKKKLARYTLKRLTVLPLFNYGKVIKKRKTKYNINILPHTHFYVFWVYLPMFKV